MIRSTFRLCSILALLTAPSLFAQGSLTPPGAPSPTMRSLDQLDASLVQIAAKSEPRIAINTVNTPGNSTALFVISSPGSYYLAGNVAGVAGKAGILISTSDVSIDLQGFTLAGVPGATSGISFNDRDRVSVRNGNVNTWPSGGIRGDGGDAARIEQVNAERNNGTSIAVGPQAVVNRCIARDNLGTATDGILVGDGSIVTQSIATGNGRNGISATTTGNLIDRCTARGNVGNGISVGADALVNQCVSTLNNRGILATSGAIITGNLCSQNTPGAGIRVTSFGNRIERNTCRNNLIGFETTITGNLVIRNLAAGNGDGEGNGGDYSLVGDGAAPRVTLTGVATNTNPHANFDF